MRKWNASMPRTAPADGNAHVVLAYKKGSGLRAEFQGELSAQDAEKLFLLAVEMMKNTKVPKS